MAKTRIGVLRGGPSSEYEVSLKTGANVLKFLPEKYEGKDILITKNGAWHYDGKERPINKIFNEIDVAFNAMHGEFGEDGKVQTILETYKIPFTGSGAVSSALAMNKILAKKIFENAGIKMPRSFIIRRNDNLNETALKIFNNFSPPWVLKAKNKGSSVGVKIVDKFYELKNNIQEILSISEPIMFEEFIRGKEATCGILENFRRERHYALPVIEIIPSREFQFFDYEAKYGGTTKEICPSNFDIDTKRKIENLARKAHEILGCKAYSRSDFIVSKNEVYLLETNTLPGLTSESLLPKSAEVVGLKFEDLLEHLINLSLNRG